MSRQLKRSKLAHKTSGFTLIELMVAMVLAVLVITPLLTFMNNIMDNDSKEQAKATSEQEIQSAVDYIAQDLEQAVYIYDADGLNNIYSSSSTSGIKNQIPPVATPAAPAASCVNNPPTDICVPILVFWKRKFSQGVISVTGSTVNNDAFVYSLVAYYLIQGNNTNGTWSKTARIGRFEIRDGVTNPTNPTNADGTPNYIKSPSSGFKLFDLTLTGQGLKDKMDHWQKDSPAYTDSPSNFILVDYIDQTQNTTASCSTNAQQVTGGFYACCPANMQQIIPPNLAGSFYACIDSSKNYAQIYIRGNALARITTVPTVPTYSNSQSTYFPTASVQIQGRGLLGNN
jgi:prepilin-type N-terminal cleavage/methylation domain-containing protein